MTQDSLTDAVIVASSPSQGTQNHPQVGTRSPTYGLGFPPVTPRCPPIIVLGLAKSLSTA